VNFKSIRGFLKGELFMANSEPLALRGEGQSPIPAGVEAFFRLMDLWDLSADEQMKLLGSPPRSTFFKWKKEGGTIPRDTLERISHLFGIYKALQILLPDQQAADSWVKRPNEYFDGRSALAVMLGGDVVDIYRVRQYLDAQRGG
jgi:uncharacterized protein (DUF2384 family)